MLLLLLQRLPCWCVHLHAGLRVMVLQRLLLRQLCLLLVLLFLSRVRCLVKAVKQVATGGSAAAGVQLRPCACRRKHQGNRCGLKAASASYMLQLPCAVPCTTLPCLPQHKAMRPISAHDLQDNAKCCSSASHKDERGAEKLQTQRLESARVKGRGLPASCTSSATVLLRNQTGDLQLLAATPAARSTPPALPSSMPCGLETACRRQPAQQEAASH